MLDYNLMSQRPSIFRDLTGMSKGEFDALHERFAAAERERRAAATSNSKGQPRRRAAKVAEAHRHGTVGRLLMTLFWLRCYPTYEVLGFFFGGLHRRNAQLNARGVLAVLDGMHGFDFDRPGPGRPKLSSPEQVMAAFPAVRLVVDAKGQRVRRPGGAYEVQRPFYSGKKKCHTVKTQFAVAPDGRIESVSDSHPGGATHDATLLLKTKLLDRLDHAGGEAAMADPFDSAQGEGYVPVRKHLPGRPLVTPAKATRNHPLTDEQKAANKVIAGYRIVVEHTIAQVSRFTALRQVFRGHAKHHPTRHSQVVRVVAGLVNLRIATCPLKTYGVAA